MSKKQTLLEKIKEKRKKELREEINALSESINAGVYSVTSPNGRSITYRSLGEMKRLRASLSNELFKLSGASRPETLGTVVRFRGQYDK